MPTPETHWPEQPSIPRPTRVQAIWTRRGVFLGVVQTLNDFHLGRFRIITDATLIGDLGADSLHVAEIALALEEDFRVPVMDAQIGAGTTVGQVVDVIHSELVKVGRGV